MAKGQVTFTFDDGISKNFGALLDVLSAENIKATMFIVGETITPSNQHFLIRAIDAGHTIGNHTWSHSNITKLSDKDLADGVAKTQSVIKKACGIAPYYFRPPYGATNAHAKQLLVDAGFTSVMWDVDARDWDRKNSKEDMMAYYHSVFDKADPDKHGYIILQHDMRLSSVEIVPQIAALVRSRGFSIVSLDEYLGRKKDEA